LADGLPDGVWFVELAPLSDSQLVPAAIFRALQFREIASNRPPVESLSRFLKTKAILLILDNCEHVIDQVAIVADALLQFCPRLQILATSREPIRISGEHTYRLPSLLAPSNRAGISAVEAASYAAINLFVDRARAVDQRFALNDENASIISDICLRVDGIPLAIELAAARVRTFSVTEIARRLDERFRILTGGTRTAVPRQRTMWATIDWSHDLLDARERILLRRLSVFSGGWTMEAAQVVCADSSLDEHEVLELMVALIEKSLVAAEVTSDNARYRLLESTQAYALEKAKQSGEHEAIAQRHADWVAGLAVDLRKAFSTLAKEQWRKAIEPEVDKIRAALSYASDINDTALTVRILWLARINNAVILREADPRTFLERRRKKENSV
jgi:predicted ATPase